MFFTSWRLCPSAHPRAPRPTSWSCGCDRPQVRGLGQLPAGSRVILTPLDVVRTVFPGAMRRCHACLTGKEPTASRCSFPAGKFISSPLVAWVGVLRARPTNSSLPLTLRAWPVGGIEPRGAVLPWGEPCSRRGEHLLPWAGAEPRGGAVLPQEEVLPQGEALLTASVGRGIAGLHFLRSQGQGRTYRKQH